MGLTALASSAGPKPAASPEASGLLPAAAPHHRRPQGRRYLGKMQVSPSCSSSRAVHRSSSSCTSHFPWPFLTWGPRELQSWAKEAAEAGAHCCQGLVWFAEGLLGTGAIPPPPEASPNKTPSSPPHAKPRRDKEFGVYCPHAGTDGHACPCFLLVCSKGLGAGPSSLRGAAGSTHAQGRLGAGGSVDRRAR